MDLRHSRRLAFALALPPATLALAAATLSITSSRVPADPPR